jgi:hypothetical protein
LEREVWLGRDTLCWRQICCADGECIGKGLRSYDTSEFYLNHPDWSAEGNIIWDSMRVIDYLCILETADAGRIGAIGHSRDAKAAFDYQTILTLHHILLGTVADWLYR